MQRFPTTAGGGQPRGYAIPKFTPASAESLTGSGPSRVAAVVLATALVQESETAVRAAFPDGIVWLTFGRNVPILAKAAELGYALTGEPNQLQQRVRGARSVRSAYGRPAPAAGADSRTRA